MAVSRVLAAILLAAVAVSPTAFATEPSWAPCPYGSGDDASFCKRWMCEQNNNRKCAIAQVLESILDSKTCAQVQDDPVSASRFESALQDCNAYQSANSGANELYSIQTQCLLGRNIYEVGMRYIPSSCDCDIGPEGANYWKCFDYVPPQLKAAGAQRVYVESQSLDRVHEIQFHDSMQLIDTADCPTGADPPRPTGTGSFPSLEDLVNATCICEYRFNVSKPGTSALWTKEECSTEIRENVYRKNPKYTEIYAQKFVEVSKPLYNIYKVPISGNSEPFITTEEEAQAAAVQSPVLAQSALFAGSSFQQ